MSTTTTIDSAGRLVTPKPLRQRYGMEAGHRVELIPGDEGVLLVPERPTRRFVRRGPIVAIDTGTGVASVADFEVTGMREEHLKRRPACASS